MVADRPVSAMASSSTWCERTSIAAVWSAIKCSRAA
jgi:hypothetical protein